MNIKINGKNYQTSVSNLNDLRAELGFEGEGVLSIYKGFAVSENLPLSDGDSVVFIRKGEVPPREILAEMITSRNTPEVSSALKGASVGVAGLGGLGSVVAIALARVGVGRLVLADFDVVDPSNLNRQQYFVSDIGKFKTDALAEHISRINPFVSVETHTVKLDENNVNSVFAPCSIVAECFDNPHAKSMLINSLTHKIIVAASGMAGYGRSEEIKTTKFARNLYVCGDLKDEARVGNGLMAPRVGVCAAHQANKILEIIIEGA